MRVCVCVCVCEERGCVGVRREGVRREREKNRRV